jgi:hypothetical protein
MFKPISPLLRRSIFSVTVVLLQPVIAVADDSGPDRLQLQQRDQVILELLERVESLENQLGVRRLKSEAPADAGTVTQEENAAQADAAQPAPGRVVVDESMAERALERSLTRAGALLLPSGTWELEPSLVYTRQEDAAPAFVTSSSGVIAAETERNSDSLSAGLLFRFGLPGDAQLEVGFPYHWRRSETTTSVNFSPVDSTSRTGSAAGDVRIALAKTLLRESSGQPDVIGRLNWDTGSGKTSDNGVSLGGGYTALSAGLTFIKRQDPVVFVSGLSYQHTNERDALQPGDSLAASIGGYLALNPQTSMNISLVLAYQQKTRLAGAVVPGSERVIGTLYIGGSSLLARGTLLNLAVGVGLTDDANDLSVSLSLPMRF